MIKVRVTNAAGDTIHEDELPGMGGAGSAVAISFEAPETGVYTLQLDSPPSASDEPRLIVGQHFRGIAGSDDRAFRRGIFGGMSEDVRLLVSELLEHARVEGGMESTDDIIERALALDPRSMQVLWFLGLYDGDLRSER